MKLKKQVWAALACVATAVALVGVSTTSASATPALNDAAPYAINVLPSVLSSASLTPTQMGALASNQHYNWNFSDPTYSAVSGAFTANPVAPATALSPSAATNFNGMVATFTPPIAPPIPLVKVLPGAVTAAFFAMSVGLLIGAGDARTFGILNDDEVCAQGPTSQIVVSIFDGVDCSGWNLALEASQKNLDNHKPVFPDTCLPNVGCWSFSTQIAYGAGEIVNCLTGPPAWGSALYSSTGLTNPSLFDTASSFNGSTHGCPAPSSSEFWSDVSDPLAAFDIYDYSTSQFSNVTVAVDSGPNPSRTIECTITTSAGHVYTASSDSFTESDGVAAAIKCPTVPPGEIPISYVLIEHGGGADQVIGSGSTTSAYQAWLTTYPECANGSCPLILSKNGDNCFNQGVVCGGWLNDDTATYTCTYGTHDLPLSTCNIYGPTFVSTNVISGHAYGDPATGALTDGQASPTARDVATRSCVSQYDRPTQTGLSTLGSVSGLSRSDWSSRCGSEAIFVTGGDARLSTAHDVQAIAENPQRMFLTFVRGSEKPRTRWYSSDPICIEANADSLDCDEFPFQSTEQGKDGLHELGTPSLAGVPGVGDNRLQGTRLRTFYGLCFADANVRDAAERDFIVVADSNLPTSGYCAP